MNTKEMATSLVMAVVVVSIFAAMISPASAAINIQLAKASVNGDTFEIGDTIEYEMTVTNHDPQYGVDLLVEDTLPNGTIVTLDPALRLNAASPSPTTSPTYTLSYVVALADIVGDRVHNTLSVSGTNDNNEQIGLFIVPNNLINTDITFDFTPVGTGCMEVKFTGTSTGPVAWHKWDFGDGTSSATISGAPNAGNAVTRQYTAPGSKTVRLYGESVTGKSGEKQRTVSVTGYPTATALVNGLSTVTLPPGGGLVTLTGTATPYTGTTITSTTWSIGPHATPSTGTGLGPVTVNVTDTSTAALTVVASNGCSATASVLIRVEEPQREVPLLTIPGAFALIGMLCIVGAGRVMRRK